jgi:uncharacterized membrane protein
MTEETTQTTTDESARPEVIIGLVTDGAHTLIVAQFPTQQDAEEAYRQLQEIERTSPLKIDGVIIANCDAAGKVHLGKVTEHSTKTGLKWGVVGGAILGVIFPPSILASAAALGTAGAALGKARNVFNRQGLADRLASVMEPNTAAIVALVENTAVVEIREALAKADRIVEQAIDKQIAAEIDREAALAKASLT